MAVLPFTEFGQPATTGHNLCLVNAHALVMFVSIAGEAHGTHPAPGQSSFFQQRDARGHSNPDRRVERCTGAGVAAPRNPSEAGPDSEFRPDPWGMPRATGKDACAHVGRRAFKGGPAAGRHSSGATGQETKQRRQERGHGYERSGAEVIRNGDGGNVSPPQIEICRGKSLPFSCLRRLSMAPHRSADGRRSGSHRNPLVHGARSRRVVSS